MAASTTVKSWAFTNPPFVDTLKQVDAAIPAEPAPTEVFIEVVAAAINPVDVQIGNASIFKLPWLAWPKSIGADFSGKIVAKGAQVQDLAIGDDVFGLAFTVLNPPPKGTLSKILVADATSTVIVKKPSTLSFAQAASLPLVWLTALTSLSDAYTVLPPKSITDRPSVVILGGSSGVGVYAVQWAKSMGLRVVATCSKANAELVRSLGADEVIDYASESIPARLAELRPPEGFTSILDFVGGTQLFEVVPNLLAPRTPEFPAGGAYITIVGDKTERGSMGGPLTYFWAPWQTLRYLRGRLGYYPRYYNIELERSKPMLEKAVEKAAKGLVVLIDSVHSFEDVPKAYEKLNSARAKGKIVIRVKGE